MVVLVAASSFRNAWQGSRRDTDGEDFSRASDDEPDGDAARAHY
jgi:hypothetical protein